MAWAQVRAVRAPAKPGGVQEQVRHQQQDLLPREEGEERAKTRLGVRRTGVSGKRIAAEGELQVLIFPQTNENIWEMAFIFFCDFPLGFWTRMGSR